MLRKLLASALAVGATLVAVPTVMAELRSPSVFDVSFTGANVVTRGWASPQPVEAQRLRLGVPVTRSLTIANEGALAANYKLIARVSGDRAMARALTVVATRREDGATVFSGPATRIQAVDLGRLTADAQETLQLRVTLSPTGSQRGDNALQGRAATVEFAWTATQA
jgi:hypothetical protein